MAHIDASLGRMVSALERRELRRSTLIIVTSEARPVADRSEDARHGAGRNGDAVVQDPIRSIDRADPNIGNHPSSFVNPNSGSPYDTVGHFQTDDVGILWVQHSADATRARRASWSALESGATAIFADRLPPGTIFSSSVTSGPALAAIFGDPMSSDPVAAARAPDVFIQPNWGTIYSGSSKKIAEHGGGTLDDRAVPRCSSRSRGSVPASASPSR